MSQSYSNPVRGDKDRGMIGKLRGVGAHPHTPTTPSQRVGEQAPRQAAGNEPLHANLQTEGQLSDVLNAMGLDDQEPMRDDLVFTNVSDQEQSRKARPRRRITETPFGQEYRSLSLSRPPIDQERQSSSVFNPPTGQQRRESEDLLDETMSNTGEPEHEEVPWQPDGPPNLPYTEAEVADIKAEWKRNDRPLCEALLPNDEECGMHHPFHLHDDDRAMTARETKRAFAIVQRVAPQALHQNAPTRQEDKGSNRESRDSRRKRQRATLNGRQDPAASAQQQPGPTATVSAHIQPGAPGQAMASLWSDVPLTHEQKVEMVALYTALGTHHSISSLLASVQMPPPGLGRQMPLPTVGGQQQQQQPQQQQRSSRRRRPRTYANVARQNNNGAH
ncbi:hypothetical protein LTR08_002733 [Meristemomyces frigidus]|nr:hypothetical protein LTR08_002733 [Meristemomyces frigidus]